MDTQAAQLMLEQNRQIASSLVESWSNKPGSQVRGYSGHKRVNFLEGVADDREDLKCLLAQMYENTYRHMHRMEEATRQMQVGSFEKFVFPIIRAVFANLVASELVTTQALNAPTGLVFYFDAIYGSNKGNINRGTRMFDARLGPSQNTQYTGEAVDSESVGAAGAAAYAAITLAWRPVRAGSVQLTDGTQIVTDDGNGNLVGDVNALGINSVNYATGAINVTFAAATAAAVTASYEVNLEGVTPPEIDLMLTSAPVIARPRKLRANWSIEAQQDFQAYHGINAEVELVAFMANEIAKEINYSIIDDLYTVAAAGDVTWERVPPAGVQWFFHKQSLYDTFIQASNLIFERTQRRNANWIVASTEVCNVVEVLDKFKAVGNVNTSVAGVQKIGTLGPFTVFKDPRMEANAWLQGFKGNSFLDCGYIYAPYLGLYTTPTIVLDDMLSRKAMMQRVGTKVVNANFYVRGSMTQGVAAGATGFGDYS